MIVKYVDINNVIPVQTSTEHITFTMNGKYFFKLYCYQISHLTCHPTRSSELINKVALSNNK